MDMTSFTWPATRKKHGAARVDLKSQRKAWCLLAELDGFTKNIDPTVDGRNPGPAWMVER
jgi:hypothetical protein